MDRIRQKKSALPRTTVWTILLLRGRILLDFCRSIFIPLKFAALVCFVLLSNIEGLEVGPVIE